MAPIRSILWAMIVENLVVRLAEKVRRSGCAGRKGARFARRRPPLS
jgi:hypothetical protein